MHEMYDPQIQEAWYCLVPTIANSYQCQSLKDNMDGRVGRNGTSCYINDPLKAIKSFVFRTYVIT